MYPFTTKESYMSKSKTKLILKRAIKCMQHLTENLYQFSISCSQYDLLVPCAKAMDWFDKDSENI